MDKLEETYYSRLKRIKDELDSYIDLRLARDLLKEKKDGVINKFIHAMQLNDASCFYDDISEKEDKSYEEKQFITAKCQSIEGILANKEESFSEMLLRLIDEKGLKDSEAYKSANIDRRLFSKIRGDENYVPSKKTAISFCLALQLEMDEAKKLLATAGYTLSASSRFDLIIMYLIEHCEYNIHFANIVLDEYGEGTLSR